MCNGLQLCEIPICKRPNFLIGGSPSGSLSAGRLGEYVCEGGIDSWRLPLSPHEDYLSDHDSAFVDSGHILNQFTRRCCGRSGCNGNRRMRSLMLSRDGQLAVTHFFLPSHLTPRTFFFPLRAQKPTKIGVLNSHTAFRMASSIENGSKWTADRVRETFLDYFKKQGHTFGRWDICDNL